MINPGLQLYAFDQPGVMRRELRYAKSIQPRSDGNGLFPVREPPPVSQLGFFLQQPVSYNLIPNWRSDDKLARSFVIGMIDHRQPLARVVWPVLAEETALAKLVLQNAQALCRNAVILDENLPRSLALEGESSVKRRASPSCLNLSAAPRICTSETLKPFPSRTEARSRVKSARPSFRNRRSMVASPIISSVSSLSIRWNE